MDIKKILLVALIAVAIVASVSAVSAGLFDGLFGEEQKDNVIEIDNIVFNTTNATNFTHNKKYDSSEKGVYKITHYSNKENNSGGNCTINIIKLHDKDTFSKTMKKFKKDYKDSKSIIDGREVYLTSADVGNYVGEPRYQTFVYNGDLNEIISICTPDANETVKIASTLKFK